MVRDVRRCLSDGAGAAVWTERNPAGAGKYISAISVICAGCAGNASLVQRIVSGNLCAGRFQRRRQRIPAEKGRTTCRNSGRCNYRMSAGGVY